MEKEIVKAIADCNDCINRKGTKYFNRLVLLGPLDQRIFMPLLLEHFFATPSKAFRGEIFIEFYLVLENKCGHWWPVTVLFKDFRGRDRNFYVVACPTTELLCPTH